MNVYACTFITVATKIMEYRNNVKEKERRTEGGMLEKKNNPQQQHIKTM